MKLKPPMVGWMDLAALSCYNPAHYHLPLNLCKLTHLPLAIHFLSRGNSICGMCILPQSMISSYDICPSVATNCCSLSI
jgi:hypothetical protein